MASAFAFAVASAAALSAAARASLAAWHVASQLTVGVAAGDGDTEEPPVEPPDEACDADAIVNVTFTSLNAEFASVARTPKVNVPEVEGVPASCPVVGSSERPVGKAPLEMEYVYGETPPAAATVKTKEALAVPERPELGVE